MELIRKQVRMNQMGKTVTDQFMIDGDYNVPDAKNDVGSVLSSEGSLRIEETRRVENYLRVTGKLNFKVLYVTDSGRSASWSAGRNDCRLRKWFTWRKKTEKANTLCRFREWSAGCP